MQPHNPAFGRPYISSYGAEQIKNYKYAGEDQSLIYKHILTPMNNRLIELIPCWVAPNLITLCGLFFNLCAHFATWYYSPTCEGELPVWVCVANAVCLFAYQTLDNLDGKQARRTKTSSPLGLLFDHGIDAVNVMVAGITMCCVISTGATWKLFVALLLSMCMFFLNTFEEFYTGSLILPVINGPTEGIIFNICVSLWTAVAGKQFWMQTTFIPLSLMAANRFDRIFSWMPGWVNLRREVLSQGGISLQYNTIPILFLTAVATVTLLFHLLNIYRSLAARLPQHKANTAFAEALLRLGVFIFICCVFTAWLFVSPTAVFVRHPRLFLWTMGFLFCKLVVHVMLAHMCNEDYRPFRRTTIPFFFCTFHTCLSVVFANGLRGIDETLLLLELFAVSFFSFSHLVVGVVSELCALLNISCFKIPCQKID